MPEVKRRMASSDGLAKCSAHGDMSAAPARTSWRVRQPAVPLLLATVILQASVCGQRPSMTCAAVSLCTTTHAASLVARNCEARLGEHRTEWVHARRTHMAQVLAALDGLRVDGDKDTADSHRRPPHERPLCAVLQADHDAGARSNALGVQVRGHEERCRIELCIGQLEAGRERARWGHDGAVGCMGRTQAEGGQQVPALVNAGEGNLVWMGLDSLANQRPVALSVRAVSRPSRSMGLCACRGGHIGRAGRGMAGDGGVWREMLGVLVVLLRQKVNCSRAQAPPVGPAKIRLGASSLACPPAWNRSPGSFPRRNLGPSRGGLCVIRSERMTHGRRLQRWQGQVYGYTCVSLVSKGQSPIGRAQLAGLTSHWAAARRVRVCSCASSGLNWQLSQEASTTSVSRAAMGGM